MHMEKYTYVLEVMIPDAVIIPDSSVKLMKLQDSFSYQTHSLCFFSKDRVLPTDILSILRNNKRKTEQLPH